LTGGGTAGHVTPNIALIEELKESIPDLKVSYIASKNGLEKALIQAEGIDYYSVSSGKLRRYFSWQNFTDLFRIPIGVWQSFWLLRRLKPDLVFSKGGYVALPVVIAAWLRRIKLIIHESDSTPGLTTRISARFAIEKWSTFPIPGFKPVNLPIRQFLYHGDSSKYKQLTKPSLLIMGGSQGANALNKFVKDNLIELTKIYYVLHIAGKGKSLNISDNPSYLGFEYVDQELADLYASADYVLCRAGASTLVELNALSKKSILVPLPAKQSRGDQLVNAEIFAKENAATLLLEENLNLENLLLNLRHLKTLQSETTNSKDNISEMIQSVLN